MWPLIVRLMGRFGGVDYTRQRINRFTLGQLEGAIAQAGFRNVRSQTFFVVAPFAAALSTAVAGTMASAAPA